MRNDLPASKKKSKWLDRLPEIRAMAGRIPASEIAKRMGTTPANLSFLCSTHKISLRIRSGATPPPPEPVITEPPLRFVNRDPIPWAERAPIIKAMAGQASPDQIAAKLDISTGRLYQLCAVHGVSLKVPRPADPVRQLKDGRFKKRQQRDPVLVNQDRCEAASKLLRDAGYTVLRPDPFRDLIDASKRQKQSIR